MIDLQAALNPLVAAKDAEVARLSEIMSRVAPGALGVSTGAAIIPWDKNGWRGHALDLTGYVETFRDDFNVMSVTDEAGSGPWYAPVHTDFGSVKFQKPSVNPNTYTIVDGKLRIRMEKVGTQWQSGHIQTMTRDGRGFNQAMGVFEFRCSFPSGGGTNGAPGYWGGPWLLSANEFIPEIGGHLTEIDLLEIYGGDAKGYHTTVHKKPRLVALPGDWNERETLSNYTTLNTAKYTDNPTVLMYPGTSWNPMDGNQHTHTVVFDDDWLTFYFDGLSICRYPMLEYWRTPQYFNFSSVLQTGTTGTAIGPQDVYIDYIRALSKA